MDFDDITTLSPVPVVNMGAPSIPQNGFLMGTPSECAKNYSRSDLCRRHYEALRNSPETLVQCPYGFASLPVTAVRVILTGIIPYPRIGGAAEALRAKKHRHNKIAAAALFRMAGALKKADQRVKSAELDAVRKQSVALHEIRKLNRKVKQTAERLCGSESPDNPDNARPELVRILKTSELMSYQFEVSELLANESLTALPLNTASEVYRVFDKCVRIYQPEGQRDRLTIHALPGFSPSVMVCEKTFPIIPTVLIENAIKYSIKDTPVRVELKLDGTDCVVSVSSTALSTVQLTPNIFERGVRATSEVEGSGIGLYLAQLVARQHGTVIKLETSPWSGSRQKVIFSLRLATVPR
jgi:signal transduction histidine kinase